MQTVDGNKVRRITLNPNEEAVFEFGTMQARWVDITILGSFTDPVYVLENNTVSIGQPEAIKLDTNVRAYDFRPEAWINSLHVISASSVEVQVVVGGTYQI